jgi:16S rRNA (guanine1207-N2)-methyltransferase
MRHYFVPREHESSEYFTFNASFAGRNLVFKSCSDVFSKDELDYGSLVLVNAILEKKELFSGKIMDMCCGYGTIAILLSHDIDAEWYLSDINSTAVELAKENVLKNAKNIDIQNIAVGNMFENVKTMFNHIVSNPPIKAGKKYLLEFVDGAYRHLQDGGTLTLVIKKNLGADSLKKYLTQLFGNCEIWDRDKGYYILHSEK